MKAMKKSWSFASDSNPDAPPYQTILYEDGTTSCDCKGWTRRVDANGKRSCRHTRLVEQGLADKYCVGAGKTGKVSKSVLRKIDEDQVVIPAAASGSRKISLD